MGAMTEVTRLIEATERGDKQAASQLLPLVYSELRRLASQRLASEQSGNSLEATGLVHEAYLRLVGNQPFSGRGHFFAAAAEAMRRILIEAARRRLTAKRGGVGAKEELRESHLFAPVPDDELLALNDALDRLAVEHPEKAELVKLRYFGGLTADEAAELIGISPSTGDRHWKFARAWIKQAME